MLSATSHNIDDYETLLVALQNVLGVIIPDGQRSYFVERIEPLLSSYGLDSFASLAEKLQNCDDNLCARILDVISQRQPRWQLNAETKNILHKYVFAQLPEKAKIWVVGCGQGQLAYSVMMEIAEYERKSGKARNFQLLATDVLQDDIEQAEQAIYTTQQLQSLRDEDKKRFFTLADSASSWQIKDKFRQKMTFSQCDLVADFESLGPMDLIICPEVLVYFSNGVKAGIIKQFADLLKSGGILLTGSSQANPVGQVLDRVDHPAGVFYRLISL